MITNDFFWHSLYLHLPKIKKILNKIFMFFCCLIWFHRNEMSVIQREKKTKLRKFHLFSLSLFKFFFISVFSFCFIGFEWNSFEKYRLIGMDWTRKLQNWFQIWCAILNFKFFLTLEKISKKKRNNIVWIVADRSIDRTNNFEKRK